MKNPIKSKYGKKFMREFFNSDIVNFIGLVIIICLSIKHLIEKIM